MKKRTIITGAVSIGILGLLVVPLLAAEGDGVAGGLREKLANSPLGKLFAGNMGRFAALKGKLNITDEQKGQIKEIIQANKAELFIAAQCVVEKKQTLRQVVLAEKSDEQSIRAAADELGKAVGDASVAIAKVAKQIRAILTPEQVKLIEQCFADNDQAVNQFFQDATTQTK